MSNIELSTVFSRLFVQINDEDRIKRKQALEKILKEVMGVNSTFDNDLFVTSKTINSIFDSGERNREIVCEILQKIINRQQNMEEFLPIIIPEFVKKLGDKDVIEPSEEIRHFLMKICLLIIEKSGKTISIFIPDLIRICCITLTDNYSEVKRISCSIINEISKIKDHNLYENVDQLIKPLIGNLCHQHSKVRVDMINCIGNVMLYNNGKSFDQVCPNMAQRLFDDNANARKAVIEVFGKWLLDLPDRYSFHSKLIPVFLSGYIDDQDDIRELANDLWYDIGIKYLQENENEKDLKDQIDFEDVNLENYPQQYERPNLGCRVLLFRTLSRILPALTRDLSDWSENTRIKAAKLLPYLILNGEGACTQHCQLLIGSTLIRGLVDEVEQVRQACRESSRLLGYFIDPKVWWNILRVVINRCDADDMFLAGEMILLSSIIQSSECAKLTNENVIDEICAYLKLNDVSGSFSTKIKTSGLRCIQSIVERFNRDYSEIYETIGYELFYSSMSFASYETQDPSDNFGVNLDDQLKAVFDKFSQSLSMNDYNELYKKYLGQLLGELINKSHHWSAHSSDRLLCSKILTIAGPLIGEFVDPVVEILEITLNKSKELELRLKFFLTLVKLTSNINVTLNSQNMFTVKHLDRLLDSAILPNLIWQSGRTAEALRRIAMTCLWGTLVGCCKSSEESGSENVFSFLPGSTWNELLIRQVAALDDDLKDTRMTSAKALIISLDIITKYDLLTPNIVNQDYLHKIYPSFIKRMDDSFDEIRIITTKIIISWVNAFKNKFDASLYKAHVEELNSGLLIHLDDSNRDVQLAVYEALSVIGQLSPCITISEIAKVRNKHRSPKYCDDLIAKIQSFTQ